MANLTTTTIDGSVTEKKYGFTGTISHQQNVNSTVVFNSVNHGLPVNQPIVFTASTGTNSGGNALLPGGVVAGTTYYIQVGWAGATLGLSGSFTLSTTPSGSKIAWASGFQGSVASPGHTFSAENIVHNTVASILPHHGANTTYTSNTTIHNTAVYNITSGKVVVAYIDTSDSSYGKAVVGTISGEAIAFGTPVNFSDTTAVNLAGLTMATLPGSSKVVIAWSETGGAGSNVNNKGTSKVGTISGTTISFGAEATFDASTYSPELHNNKCMVSDTTNNRVILAWYGGNPTPYRQIFASCGTVSGTTLTWSTAVAWGGGPSVAFQYQSVVYDATADKFVIAWENSTTNAQHVVGTAHTGTNAITFGTPVVDAAYSWDAHAMTYSAAAGKIVHIFRKYGISPSLATGFARVGTISGTTVSWGVESTFPLTSTQDMYDPNIIYHADTQKVFITYSGSNREIYGVGGTITGTTISLSTRILINDVNLGGGATSDPGLAYDTVTKKVVLSTNTLSGTKAELLDFDGTNLTVDLATGNFFEVDLETTNNISAITTSNPAAAHISSFILKLTQGSTARQIDFSELSAFKWIGGTTPTLTTTNNAVDILSFTTYDYGTTWLGAVVGQNYS